MNAGGWLSTALACCVWSCGSDAEEQAAGGMPTPQQQEMPPVVGEPGPPTRPTDPVVPPRPPSVEPPPRPVGLIPVRCAGDASQTAMIGDSYMAFTGEMTAFLEGFSGQTYRTYYVSGTQMVGGLITPTIPDQARIALGEGPVQTFIMNGGGNDILIGDVSCRATGPAPGSPCEVTVLNALAAATGLMEEAAGFGVREVIYFFYPHLPPGLLALNHIALNEVLDFAAPLARDLCENNSLVDCTFVDLRPSFEGHPEFIGPDGIHPTTPGSDVIAQLVWAVMQKNCADGLRVL